MSASGQRGPGRSLPSGLALADAIIASGLSRLARDHEELPAEKTPRQRQFQIGREEKIRVLAARHHRVGQEARVALLDLEAVGLQPLGQRPFRE